MKERIPGAPLYIPVQLRMMVPSTPFYASGRELQPSDIGGLVRSTQYHEGFNRFVRMEAVQQTPRQQAAVRLAGDMINRFQGILGLPVTPRRELEAVFLGEEAFNYSVYHTTGQDIGPDMVGYSTYHLDPVVVKNNNFPAYYLGKHVLHELTHRHIDQPVSVYNAQLVPDLTTRDSQGEIPVYAIETEERRLGLSIVRTNKAGVRIVPPTQGGELLNELGNAALEYNYLRDRIRNNEPEFKEEIERRNQLIAQDSALSQMDGMTRAIPYHTSDGKERLAVFRPELIHFDNDGNLLLLQSVVENGRIQLAYDLNSFCGQINGESFGRNLVRAKTDLSLLTKLREVVDAKLGKGFFHRLHTTSYHGSEGLLSQLDILQDVQHRMYGVPAATGK